MRLGDADRRSIAALLATIERPVPVRLELGPSESGVTLLAGGRELDPLETTREVVAELASLSDLIALEIVEREERGPYPRTTIAGRAAFTGTPWGHELTALVHGVVEAGRPTPSVAAATLERLASIEGEPLVEVFVTPTCASCPPVVLHAFRCALAGPWLRAEAVESSEFPERTDRAGVHGVPAVVVGGRPAVAGRVSEDVFVGRVAAAARWPAGP